MFWYPNENIEDCEQALETLKWVFQNKLSLRVGQIDHGGAAYCLRDFGPGVDDMSITLAEVGHIEDDNINRWQNLLWNTIECILGFNDKGELLSIFRCDRLGTERYKLKNGELTFAKINSIGQLTKASLIEVIDLKNAYTLKDTRSKEEAIISVYDHLIKIFEEDANAPHRQRLSRRDRPIRIIKRPKRERAPSRLSHFA